MAATVLVVDDDNDTLEALGQFLAFEGFDVRHAGDGLAALQLIESGFTPCAVVLDLLMPRMGGREFLVQLEARHLLRTVPIILASGATGPIEPLPRQVLSMPKPYDVMELVQLISNHCRRAA